MHRKDSENAKRTSDKVHSAGHHSAGYRNVSEGWATIDKNSGVIQVRWWVPLVIVGGAMMIIAISCSLIWGYKRMNHSSGGMINHSANNIDGARTSNSSPKFGSMQEAEYAYRDLYQQIDGFCKTVKSPG